MIAWARGRASARVATSSRHRLRRQVIGACRHFLTQRGIA
jgi:hypothetical protein